MNEEPSITNNPLVSIITPVLNGIKYLEPCLQSVLHQTYPYVEHIFVDGGSADGTLATLASYQARYPDRIRFISELDRGAGEAWNKGLWTAKGEIFGWLGADDLYEPDAIQAVVEFFRGNPGAYVVFGGLNYINEKGEIIGKQRIKEFDLKGLINDWSPITTPATFYKREVIERVGWLDTKGDDFDFFIRIGKAFKVYHMHKVLANFRSHKESQTGSGETNKFWRREDYLVGRRHGAGVFSPRSRRYYTFVIAESLRPVLGFAYPLINKLLGKLIRRLSQ